MASPPTPPATDLDLEAVPAEAFLEDSHQRDLSRDVIKDVLSGAAKCFEEEGLPQELVEKFQALWFAKLDTVRRENPDLDINEELASKRREEEEDDEDEDEEEVIVASSDLPLPGPSSGARPKTSAPASVAAAKKRARKRRKHKHLQQLDGPNDTSDDDDGDDDELDDDDDDDDDDDLDDDDLDNDDDDQEDGGVEEEPLGSEDDISEEDPSDLFDTENVVVCQYDKITRARNKWKFHLKDGIMNLNGKDYVFQRANGDAEW